MTAPPADLSKLHDFYYPPPISWKPQTIGWYTLFAVLALALMWFAYHAVRRWHHNRYRRLALKELPNTPPELLSALLKRTALAAWPRDTIASLTGSRWLAFLTRTSSLDSFQHLPGSHIEEIALSPTPRSPDEERRLRDLAAKWIRRHRVQA
jgi:Domain of unknown function (DUF4381)